MSPGLALETEGAHGGRWKRYPAYKDSGVGWVGEVPERWGVKRLKYLASESLKYGANESAELDDPDLPRYIRITDIAENGSLRVNTFKSLPEDVARPYLLKSGDILFARSGATVGKSFIYQESWGRACYAGYLIRLRVNSRVAAPEFISYFASSSAYWDWVSSIFIQATIQNISAEKYANFYVAIPPLPEQRAIAAFLDRETGCIDALIAKKERQIELLQEKRAALISHAVTKGLDPDAPMKDSGVEWLGEVPEHWAEMRIKHLLHQIIDTEHKTAPYSPDGNYLVVRTANVRNGILSFDDAKYTDSEGFKEWTRRGVPKPGDILFTREAPAGEACIVPDNVPLCIGQRMVLFRVNKQRLDARFGIYSIYGGLADEFIRSLSQGSTVEHFNMSDIGNTPLFEPSLSEQHTIAAFLDHETGHSDILTTKVYESISKLHEYRTALISAAVTGKIDVRGEET